MSQVTIHARVVFPIVGPPIDDGWVAIEDSQIAAVGSGRGEGMVHDLGNAAILPGLVNAHAHLDFSNISTPIGEPGIGFVDWIRRVTEFRRTDSRTVDPVERGLAESVYYGVTTVGDISQPGSVEPQANDIGVTSFLELIAPTHERVAAALDFARTHLSQPSHFLPALSPHAPFSVHPELLAAVIELSANQKVPMAMHLAESQEEMQLLRDGTGPLRAFLEEIGAWDSMSFRPTQRPMDFLRPLALAHRALVIHGTYLDDEEIAYLGDHCDRMAVVFCPRTHDWFGRGDYPLEKMIAAGVLVALGTDGRGSSPNLDLLAEMRHAARRHPDVRRDRILRMGTLDGATALGLADRIGSLECGKQANLTIVSLPDRAAADPHDLIFDSAAEVIERYFSGESSLRSPDLPNRRSSSSSTSVNVTPQ
jgi:cytosine/adenosine deaminase-related metal-dependent hydrolase